MPSNQPTNFPSIPPEVEAPRHRNGNGYSNGEAECRLKNLEKIESGRRWRGDLFCERLTRVSPEDWVGGNAAITAITRVPGEGETIMCMTCERGGALLLEEESTTLEMGYLLGEESEGHEEDYSARSAFQCGATCPRITANFKRCGLPCNKTFVHGNHTCDGGHSW